MADPTSPARQVASLDLSRLLLFAKVAELGSLTRAAVAMDTLQSAVSRRIAALERDCGGRLFHRTGRGVTLTDLGRRVLPAVTTLLADAERLTLEMRASPGAAVGTVSIGTLPSLSHPLVNLLFAAVRERHPGIRLRVLEGSSGQLDEWVSSGRVDIALLFRYGRSVPRHEQALSKVDTYLVGPVGDALTRGATVPFARLHHLPLILPGAPNGLRVALDQCARRKRVELSVVLEADSLPIQKDVVAEGGGWTILAGHAVSQDVRDRRLQAARIVTPSIDRIITLCTTTRRPLSQAAREVARLSSEIVAGMVRAGTLRHGR